MRILAHRGLWRERRDGNTLASLTAALAHRYSIEFDVRDAHGRLVIAHDVDDAIKPCAIDLIDAYCASATTATLAVNIKADGLGSLIEGLLVHRGISNYFCFDMSVPETLRYRRLGVRYFTRLSEHEPRPVLYEDAAGVWMDMFESDWITVDHIRPHLDRGKEVALVSPELHGRLHMPFWERVRRAGLSQHPALMLCTDHPDAARSFFDA